MIHQGWQESTQHETVSIDWFDLLCAFFVEEIKQNPWVSTILQTQPLVNLSVREGDDEVAVDYDAFIQQLEQFGAQVLQQIEQVLEQLRQEQTAGFQMLQERIDEYLPTLLGLTEQIHTLVEALHIEATRRPLYERYPGQELTQRTETVIRDHTLLFVGRDEEMEQLDALFRQSSGALVITAPAGYGKTALLANWLSLRHNEGCFIARHFFRKEYDDVNRLDSVPNALFNLLRQLYIYYGVEGELPPRDEGLLRDTLLGLLRERGARDDEPLVLLLDGLDEAERELVLTLPEPLPEGVYVVASIRADRHETPAPMRSWLRNAQRLPLDHLSRDAVGDYLTRAGDGELTPYAQDARFVEQVARKTEGYPLYLRYLAEELVDAARRGEKVDALLERTPRGFNEYVQAQVDRLAQAVQNAPKVQRLFALLASAQGALAESDVETLAELTPFELAALPWQVTRWFARQERDGERYYAFTHPRLGDAFKSALGNLAQEARQQLLDYCARWEQHSSPYALRHYAAHLKESGDYDALYALARNERYIQAQSTRLPSEPELPLRTLQTALQAAIEQENLPVIAEVMCDTPNRLSRTTKRPSKRCKQATWSALSDLRNRNWNRTTNSEPSGCYCSPTTATPETTSAAQRGA